MKVWIGIDPGFGGAVAAILEDGGVIVHDAPVVEVAEGRRDYDVRAMSHILHDVAGDRAGEVARVLCVLEKVHSLPREGVHSAFVFGRGVGLWEGMLAEYGIPYEPVTPQRWKKALMDGMPKEKQASILRAKQLFPRAELTLRKHHGRADALLLAEYARRLRP